MTKIFALGHRRYVGKDTAARFLINHIRLEHRGQQVQKISFATKLKATVYDLFKDFGVKSTEFYEQNPAEKETVIPALGISVRDLWIKFGNQMREYKSDLWIHHAFTYSNAPILLIPDLRYLDEAEAVKERGGVLIKINRLDVHHYDDVADNKLAEFDGWDYIINNDYDLAELQKAIINVVDQELVT